MIDEGLKLFRSLGQFLFVIWLFTDSAFAQLYFEYKADDFLATGSEVSVTAVGDVMLGSWVISVLAEKGLRYPFEKTVSVLRAADVAIANLEAPFTRDTTAFKKKFNFKVPPEYVGSLVSGGFDVVTLANNHTMDYGEGGLIETMRTLDNAGIKHSGAGINLYAAHQPTVVQVGDKKLAFFGYSMTFPTEFYATRDSSGTAYPEPEIITKLLRRWDELADYVIVSFHWSAEKLQIPKDYQIYFAHLAIDNGADLVLGHHPHVLQGFEIYRNRLIAYSLGNFVFGSYSRHAVDSVVLNVFLNNSGLLYARCLPINVDNSEVEFQPYFFEGERRQAVISKLQNLSLSLNSYQIIDDAGFIFGDWAGLYHDWLLNIAVRTYWRIHAIDEILSNNFNIAAYPIDSDFGQ